MVLGALIVVFGGFAAGAYALGFIAVGSGGVLSGYLLDWRSDTRAAIAVGICVSWVTVVGALAFVLILVAAAVVSIRRRGDLRRRR